MKLSFSVLYPRLERARRRAIINPNKLANQNTTGFTIVELLIVVVVIAILAAISVVAYMGIQNRSYNSAVEADVTAIIKKMELAKVDLGHYPHSAGEFPDGFEFSKSAYNTTANNIYYIVDKTDDRYAFGLRSQSGRGYIINTGTMVANAGPISSTTTAAPLGIPWGTNNDSTNPPLSAVLQGHIGPGGGGIAEARWNSSWKWTD